MRDVIILEHHDMVGLLNGKEVNHTMNDGHKITLVTEEGWERLRSPEPMSEGA